MARLLWGLVVTIVSALVAPSTIACICEEPLEMVYDDYDYAFVARLTAAREVVDNDTQLTFKGSRPEEVVLLFKVLETLKGNLDSTIELRTYTDCGIGPYVGRQYLIFADSNGYVSTCGSGWLYGGGLRDGERRKFIERKRFELKTSNNSLEKDGKPPLS